ncbi:hypothetical protein G7Y89_g12919 [Cudoniella acicularis]|uniref:2-isopropylmalate synthase n=1 Tax=Cudoniella acicularis TaxID=354080 RepID=A0A8H4RAA7_9HELO|nr:hypothetical protein G7Y89_g12919 [Cudoniella acicularis]
MSKILSGGLDLATKYGGRAPRIDLPDRQWPSKYLTKAPTWLSTDLRDGNQALPNPMTMEQKIRYFKLLVEIGFKEIEVSFPCASQTEYDFTRYLIESGSVPDDVELCVLTPCRKETLLKAMESVRGAKKAILFTYLSTSDNYRETVLGISEEEWLEKARVCTEYARSITKESLDPEIRKTQWTFGFGFEDFANARPEAVLALAETISAAWRPSKESSLIIGLGSSVESSTPNVYADQVEYICRNLSKRELITISLHPHNDRGTGIAACELGCLAGADRVEGCLFGNGERAGNLDLVTVSLNMFTQGIDTGLDFSNIRHVRAVYEEITGINVHPRAPYGGDFYFRAFSGGHQDAISKGFRKQAEAQSKVSSGVVATTNGKPSGAAWRIPYLPMDPADLGLPFDVVISSVNSQSGKAGVSWLIQQRLGFLLPNELAIEFSKVAKAQSDALKRGLSTAEIGDIFVSTYHVDALVGHNALTATGAGEGCAVEISIKKLVEEIKSTPERSPAKVLSRILGLEFTDIAESSHTLAAATGTGEFVSYVKCTVGSSKSDWGVGIGEDDVEAATRGFLSILLTHGYVELDEELGERWATHNDSAVELHAMQLKEGGASIKVSA